MKTLSMLCILLASGTVPAWPQTDSVRAGKNALLFQVGSNFTLSAFEGQLVSFKHMTSDSKGWRFGLSLSGSHTEGEELILEDTVYVKADEDYSFASLTATFSFQHYRAPVKPVRFYFGYGVTSGFSHQWNNSGRSFSGNSIRFGFIGNLGMEWFFHENVSVSGEYGASLTYRYLWRDYELPDTGQDFKIVDHTVDFRPEAVRLGISAYF